MSTTTDTSICNSALSKVGANRIIALTDNTVEARICKEQYTKVKQKFLRGHPWNFATKRVSLALLATAPAFGFYNAYQIPTDCLRVKKVDADETYPWKVEGTSLVTDNPSAYVEYIADVGEGLFDAYAAEALASVLAYEICMTLTQSATVKESLKSDMNMELGLARSFDAQESTGDRVYADTWLNSRA